MILLNELFQETWHGDYNIYCILALSGKPATEGSTIEILEGGVNHTFVSFDLKSSRGHGVDYSIKVFANTAGLSL